VLEEHFFSRRSEMFEVLLDHCRQRLQAAVHKKTQASLLVSGGSSPEPLYRQLAKTPLEWSRITVALVDERWVEAGEPGSNETFIVDNLLQDHARGANLVAMKNSADTAIQGQPFCEAGYQQLGRPFDLTILGMGVDGHTASLFPNATGLGLALDINQRQLCVAIDAQPTDVTGKHTERMTLSLYGLLQSEAIYLLISGPEKLAVYEQAKQLAGHGDQTMPVSRVLNQRQVPVQVYWAP
jgi:6-phosphogluconolactonase|tara:strand:+ start:834 stop:1550 length:717 start_codon:yes stop_codon:yes gene_type:complete